MKLSRSQRKKKGILRLKKKGHSGQPMICESCGCQIFFNLELCKDLGMCGTCITGEARYNYEEVHK